MTNDGASAVDKVIELEIDGVLNNFWNSTLVQEGDIATGSGADCNASTVSGAYAEFGFCANR